MRLLDTDTGQFVQKDPKRTVYAILSHTWDTERGEQTFEQLKTIQRRYEPSTSSSPEQDRDGPPPTPPPPSQLRRGSISVTTSPPTSSTCSKSCFTRRIVEFGMRYLCCSARSALQIQNDTHASVRTSLDAPSSNSPPAPSSNDPHSSSSSDPSAPSPALQSKPPPQSIWDNPELSPKIRDACAVARAHGYRYIWIDSCCIDKSSSSELSEAINSMYAWYATAGVCYAYLADVPPGDDHEAQGSRFRKSWWFTRGWTLQELIAPVNVVFLSEDWAPIGSKHALGSLVESVTKIDYKALLHLEPLAKFTVAERLSWAANRKTTREEDRAYSMLGIFDIHMPTLYGEGDRAFRRLQEQIMQRIPDQSLFAWGDIYLGSRELPGRPALTDTPTLLLPGIWPYHRSPFAPSPREFQNGGSIHGTPHHDTIRRIQLPASHCYDIEYTSTPYGVRTQFQMVPLTRDLFQDEILHSEVKFFLSDSKDTDQWYLAILACEHADRPGHLLGRVCYIPPSESSIEFVYTGYIRVRSRQANNLGVADLFPVSPKTVEHLRPHTELKTVYMSYPDRAHLPSILRHMPYGAIKLVLLRETSDALRSRGYSANLRDPDPDHPTTHWLTLSTDEHTITAQFQHTQGRW
ncbi:HET-domain-containing protein [Ganoderma leucocontextum]|nr:HET-domain-containing protein [Ganoderma leucocontextum]